MESLRARAAAGALAAIVGAGLLTPAAEARLVKRKRVAEGVVYRHYVNREKRRDYHVVTVKLSAPSRLGVALSNEVLAGFERTSSMARRKGALVAINGDYARPTGRPVMTFARRGFIDQSPLAWGRNFAVKKDETRAYIGHPKLEVTLSAEHLEHERWIARVNEGGPYGRELALFTPAGKGLEPTPKGACSARLYRTSFPRISSSRPGVEVVYEVDRVVCRRAPLARHGGVVLAADRDRRAAKVVAGFAPGDRAMLSWSLGWQGVGETVGGNPTLVEDGKVVVHDSAHPFFRPHPRTGVGSTGDNTVILIAADGRRRRARGFTLKGFARLFRSFGARWALNLDGGGSTTMWVRGLGVVNRPSDGSERAVSSALLVLPGARRANSRAAAPEPVASPAAWHAAATDPASIGGLASVLERRGRALPGALQGAARTFAAAYRRGACCAVARD